MSTDSTFTAEERQRFEAYHKAKYGKDIQSQWEDYDDSFSWTFWIIFIIIILVIAIVIIVIVVIVNPPNNGEKLSKNEKRQQKGKQ